MVTSLSDYEDEYLRNLKDGQVYERKVLKLLKNSKKDAEIYVFNKNGKECQIIEINNGKFVRCPDIQVFKNAKEVILRIEVKSMKDLYRTKDGSFVTIKYDQFEDYLSLLSSEEVEIKVVFIMKKTNEWFWQDLFMLSIMVNEPVQPYLPKDSSFCYMWNIECLSKDFGWISQ